MTLQDRIKRLSEYNIELKMMEGNLIVRILFKEKWRVEEPNTSNIAFAPDEKVKGLYWYLSQIEYVDEIFDAIDAVIQYNKNREKKITLYHEKVNELKALFTSDETYENLSTLTFTMNKKKTRPYRKKKKEETKNNVDIQNEDTAVENLISNDVQDVADNEIDAKIMEAINDTNA